MSSLTPRYTSYIAIALIAGTGSAGRAQSPACFSGPIRPACSGFVLFEGSAVVSRGASEHTLSSIIPFPPSQGGPDTLVTRFNDLSSYFSGALGYLRVTGPRSAVGAVAELGFNVESDLGNTRRVAVTARMRRQYASGTVDLGAGPLGVQVVTPADGFCCRDRVIAYGGTAEAAGMFHGYLGLTAGADLIHGAGRTSSAVHVGVRAGSYGAVAAAAVTAALGAFAFWALSRGSD